MEWKGTVIALLFCWQAFGQQASPAGNIQTDFVTIINAFSADNHKNVLREFNHYVRQLTVDEKRKYLTEYYFTVALALALNNHLKESIYYHKKAIRTHHKFRKSDPLEIELNLGLTYHLAGKERKARKILGGGFTPG